MSDRQLRSITDIWAEGVSTIAPSYTNPSGLSYVPRDNTSLPNQVAALRMTMEQQCQQLHRLASQIEQLRALVERMAPTPILETPTVREYEGICPTSEEDDCWDDDE